MKFVPVGILRVREHGIGDGVVGGIVTAEEKVSQHSSSIEEGRLQCGGGNAQYIA